MKKIEYKKLQYDYIDYLDKIDNDKFLNMYLYLFMNVNAYGYITTSLQSINDILELSLDKRMNKVKEYKELLNIMSNDILNNKNEIELSQILEYSLYVKKDEENSDLDNKDIIKINLLALNEDITTKYIKVYYEEYEYLYDICKEVSKNRQRKVNINILINLYFYLKYKIKIHQVMTKEKESGTLLSLVTISKKLNISDKTVNIYLNILQEYNMITFEKGQYTNDNHTQRESNKYWLNDKWLDFDEEEINNEDNNINNIDNTSSKVTNISEYLKEG